jgi:hypothetical protein
MSKIFVRKHPTLNALIPVDATSETAIAKMNDKAWSLEYNKARNPKFHRMVFSIAQMVCDNAPEDSYWHEKYGYHFIKACELKAGFVDELIDLDGEIHLLPKSIAFESMADDEFKKIFDVMVKESARILGCSERDVLQNMETV